MLSCHAAERLICGWRTCVQVSTIAGWSWAGGWDLDRAGHVDKDGWAYGQDFGKLRSPPAPGSDKPSVADTVRRRRWVRRRQRASPGGRTAAAAGSQRLVITSSQDIGRVQAGEMLPLPLDWEKDGASLRRRDPLIGHLRRRSLPCFTSHSTRLGLGVCRQAAAGAPCAGRGRGRGRARLEQRELRRLQLRQARLPGRQHDAPGVVFPPGALGRCAGQPGDGRGVPARACSLAAP